MNNTKNFIDLPDFIRVTLPWIHLPTDMISPMLETSTMMVESTFIPPAFKKHLIKSHEEILAELARRN